MRADITLPAEPRSARAARAFVRETLHHWRLDPLLDQAELLTSELVANVVLHVGTPLDLTLVHPAPPGATGGLRVEVRDGSTRQPRHPGYSDLAATGRGLQLVRALASRHGVDVEPHGKSVWFELGAAASGGAA